AVIYKQNQLRQPHDPLAEFSGTEVHTLHGSASAGNTSNANKRKHINKNLMQPRQTTNKG
ncbi:MAG: hypothetical protein ACKPKO_42340, partial [Candidatus Fonsibacter sp.]